MQRESKKTKLPVKIVTNAGKRTLLKVPEQEKLVAAKKQSDIAAVKNANKSKTGIHAKIPTDPRNTKKPAAVNQSSKQTITIARAAAKQSTPKRVQIKPETAGTKVEVIIPPIKRKPVKKKIRLIGSAVVRGKIGRYDFDVFSLDTELKEGAAIYVISKRVTDPRGKGHHKFVCIGQTESLLGDVQKHIKGKCIKQHKANAICLLREENEKIRTRIEADLLEAHTIVCNHQQAATDDARDRILRVAV